MQHIIYLEYALLSYQVLRLLYNLRDGGPSFTSATGKR
jgi:hypothetical protein